MTCENGVTAEWDTTTWGIVNINSNNSKKIKCNVDFKESVTLIKYLKNLQSNELVEDDFGNLRYIGKNPNNFVTFNNEKWRIIGVMKNIENADGSKEDKVKLIRMYSIGSYSWDNKASGTGSSTSSSGSNDWSDSELQKVLNEGAYYNRTSGDCPYGQNGATKACDFSSTGLTNEAKSMISKSVWDLGGIDSVSKKVSEYYTSERGSTVSSGRPTKWIGKVGLMYPSDYGYSTSGGTTTDRGTCLNTSLYDWSESGVSDCINNNWILRSEHHWTLSSEIISSDMALDIHQFGFLTHYNTSSQFPINPAVFLVTSLLLGDEGDGSFQSPFTLKNP